MWEAFQSKAVKSIKIKAKSFYVKPLLRHVYKGVVTKRPARSFSETSPRRAKNVEARGGEAKEERAGDREQEDEPGAGAMAHVKSK